MSQDHRCRVLNRIRRLRKIIAQTDQRTVEQHINKRNAREALARMKVMHDVYMMKLANGDFDVADQDADEDDDGTIESMVADMIDTSFTYSEYTSSKPAIACTDPVVFGREQEIELLKQELQAESVDDFDELWNIEPANAVTKNDMGEELDFESLRDYASDSEPGHTCAKDFYIDGRRKWHKRLTSRSRYSRNSHRLDRKWPPPIGTKARYSEDEIHKSLPQYDRELIGEAMDDQYCEFGSLGCLCQSGNRRLAPVSRYRGWELVLAVLVILIAGSALSLSGETLCFPVQFYKTWMQI